MSRYDAEIKKIENIVSELQKGYDAASFDAKKNDVEQIVVSVLGDSQYTDLEKKEFLEKFRTYTIPLGILKINLEQFYVLGLYNELSKVKNNNIENKIQNAR